MGEVVPALGFGEGAECLADDIPRGSFAPRLCRFEQDPRLGEELIHEVRVEVPGAGQLVDGESPARRLRDQLGSASIAIPLVDGFRNAMYARPSRMVGPSS